MVGAARVVRREVVGCLALLAWWAGGALASPLGLSGDWYYRTWSTPEGTGWSFHHTYSADCAHDLTEMMHLSGTLRYAEDQTEGRTHQHLAPTLTLDVRNDLFCLNASGTTTRERDSEGPDITSSSLDLNLTSAWQRWPALRVSYGRSSSHDDQHPRGLDQESNYANASLSFSLGPAGGYYNWRRSEDEDKVSGSRTTTWGQLGRLEATCSLWNDRLSLSASQQLSYTRTESEGPVGPGGYALLPVAIDEARWGAGRTDLSPAPSLLDGDRRRPAGPELGEGGGRCVGLRTEFREADVVCLYLEGGTPRTAGLSWNLYRSADGRSWELVREALACRYREEGRCLEIDIPRTGARWLLLELAAWPPDTRLCLTEVEAKRRVWGAGRVRTTDRFRSLRTDLSVHLTPHPRWSCSYAFSRSRSMPVPGPDTVDQSHAATLSWTGPRWCSPTFSFNQTEGKTQGEPRTLSRSYSLSVTSSPLGTLDASGGFTRTDTFRGGRRQSTTNAFNLYLTAPVLPELNASLTLTHTRSHHYPSGVRSRDTTARLVSTVRVTPKYTAELTYECTRTLTRGEDTTRTTAHRLSLCSTWRPSDILLTRATTSWSWQEAGRTYNTSYGIWWAPTRRLQLNLRYTSSGDGSSSRTWSSFLSWEIGPHLSLKISADRTEDDGRVSWSVSTRLTARF